MKKVISLILVAVIAVCALSGCAAIAEAAIVGTWKSQTNILGVAAETEYVFNEDGTGSISAIIDVGVAIKYTIEEDTLTIVTDTPILQKTFKYTYEFDGSDLILTDDSGKTITLTQK